MDSEQSFATEREQRMLAVAKLKRAASLPRLKDGRRPPMHTEAVSEGEKGNLEDEMRPDIETPPNEEPPERERVQKEVTVEKEEAEENAEQEIVEPVEVEVVENEVDPSATPPPTRSKRRSRSRSRSRGSKDFKGKARAQQSPTPTLIQGDSSQDEAFVPSPITLPVVPQLISPIPSQFQRSMLLSRTPTPNSQEHPVFQYPGTSPPTPLPTLEALQKGLFRSNSAGRMMAMHKLTGGTDTYEPSPSPTPPISAKFRRNNTVSGGERSAARKKLIDTLGSRAKVNVPSNPDGEQTSGTEEPPAPSPSPSHKRKRRRSRRGSASAGAGSAGGALSATESEWPPTSSNTPQVPPTPLPPSSLGFYPDMMRALSATPNQASSSGAHSPRNVSPLGEIDLSHTPPPSISGPADRDRPRRRSVVVEEEEEDQSQSQYPTRFSPPPLPSTPPKHFAVNGFGSRLPHTSDPPSDISGEYTMTSGINIPVYISDRAPSREDGFPSSPFGTPLKERPSRDEDEEERVLYPADTSRERLMYDNDFEREISWVASPVPEIRMPIDDDEDDGAAEDEYEEEQTYDDRRSSPHSSGGFYQHEVYDDVSPRVSSGYQNVGGDSETSPDTTPSYVPPSPSSLAALSGTASIPRESDGSVSPTSYPTRLSVASRIQGIPSSPLSPDFGDLEDRPVTNDASSKRSADSTSTSTWEKVKNTFRSNSSLGRRSRSNSIVTPTRKEELRESAASSTSISSPRLEKSDSTSTFAAQQVQPPGGLSPSASNSMLSLSPTPGSRSPIPPSTADLSKYQNAKLFPFPGMKKLEEERNRARGLHSASASTPDINALLSSSEEGQPLNLTGNGRPQLSQQVSDTNLFGKFTAPPLSTTTSWQSSNPDYFTISPSPSTPNTNTTIKLPTTLPGVKQWLSKNIKNKVSSPASSPSSPNIPNISPPPTSNGGSLKKPSLSDLFRNRKDNDLGTDWEELGNTPTDTSGNTLVGVGGRGQKQSPPMEERERILAPMTPPTTSPIPFAHREIPEVDKTPTKPHRNMAHPIQTETSHPFILSPTSSLPSPPDPTSTTPDLSSSLSDYPAPSTSDSSSTNSSRYSGEGYLGPQGSVVLQKLEEQLSRSSRSPMWATAIDDPPRKLILASPVLQVVNSNTVKDRFLFLFSDILVIAKPVLQDDDVVMDRIAPSADRRFTIKSVVQLQHLRVAPDRTELSNRASGIRPPPRNPIIRTFVLNFSKNPDFAISTLFSKSGMSDDPVLLGQLLFRTTEIDRVQLGSYLAQRTSKLVLKSYLDSFGFVHLRVDRALRVFLMSLHVPSQSFHHHSALEYMLDAFASRWYEANARFIAYDKDLAIRLVRGLNQLNDLLHGGLASEPGLPDSPRRNISSRDFIDAFRRCDMKCLVSDELLEEIYDSIRGERLCHARNTQATASADIMITNKRPLPPVLTYKVTSEPVSFRIPQPDPHFRINLFGQDLIIDPPVLTFEKSSEARFRVTGTSLGPKTIIMCRSGQNALKYGGLPLALRITIERAFMRHTFQLAFVNHCGEKRRYMFSVDDPIIRHKWAVDLRQHIDNAQSSATTSSSSPGPSKFYRAAETVAFKVLQETLIGRAASSSPTTLVEAAMQRLTNNGVNGSPRLGLEYSPSNSAQRGARAAAPLHIRSKSRSKVYHRSKAGKNESDIVMNGLENQDSYDNINGTKSSSPGSSTQPPTSAPSDSPTWSGRELEMQCLQNSSIALVLSFLQVGSPEHGVRSS
ncbi:hypothetical protein PM082_001765 [Marasmius tenuissimus]|nr:hypothetical protein PM082_001765 [Marasmius tenuissimus]